MRFSVPFVPAIDDGSGTNPVPDPSIKRESGSAPMHQRVMGGLNESVCFEVLSYCGEELTPKIGGVCFIAISRDPLVFQYIQLLLSDHPASNIGGIPAIKRERKITQPSPG
jgi:hypothetical protein